MALCYLGLGSNLEDPLHQLRKAGELLAEKVEVSGCSSIYKTEPQGLRDQNWFYNQVIQIKTELEPGELLEICREIETAGQRIRTIKNGPRTIDVDILLYGNLRIESPELILPHPRMTERAFVLIPLQELAMDMYLQEKPIQHFIEQVQDQKILKLEINHSSN
jgi:2-amino-4-hydroxy-6-hydroxymethyldihydropteridine diphosphokinase